MSQNSLDDLVSEVRSRRRAGRTVVQVGDVDEAVAVAEALKAAGDYDLFRGQVGNWPMLTPKLFRLAGDEADRARLMLNAIVPWARRTPGLEDLAQEPDKMEAVAQHYGIPTTFLDFTTEPGVAGFFAADCGPPPAGMQSCLILLDTREADRIWPSVKLNEDFPIPEVLRPDVANLWRLEAQHGVFVYCPYENLDIPYPLDRLVFPYTGASAVPRDSIYPTQASVLETQLNHFLQELDIHFGMEALEDALRETPSIFDLELPDLRFEPDAFVAPPEVHPSWPRGPSPWLALARESWASVAADKLRPSLQVRTLAVEDLRRDIFEQVEALGPEYAGPKLWGVELGDGVDPASVDVAVLSRALGVMWGGMSRLPYRPSQLAAAAAQVVLLHTFFIEASKRSDNESEVRSMAADMAFESPVKVELSAGGANAHAFAWASDAALRKAWREDLPSLLKPEIREHVLGWSFNMLLSARDPHLLFDFDGLCDLFASELIPSQVVLDHRNPPFFSPARLDILGPD